MNKNTTFSRSMFGLTDIAADNITTNTMTTNTLTMTGPLKTNLIQSTGLAQDITIEAQGAGEVIIKSNGVNIAIFDTANNLITFNNRVSQERPDGAVSYGPNCLTSVTTGTGLTAFGEFALQDITTAQNSSAFGYQALANANGNGNSAFGHRSLAALTSGTSNLAMGSSSGVALVSGSTNVFMGQNAGSKTTSGSFNTLIGGTAGNNNLTGGSNVCIGANTGHNNSTLYGATSNNVCIGTSSGGGLLLSNGCTMIGHQSNNTLNIGNFSNSTCIGISSVITSSNQIQLGRSTEYVSAQKMSLGKTSVPANTLDIVGDAEINNGSLFFSKSTGGTQTIQWFDQLGQALGLLYASTISSAFVFEVGPPAVNGFQVRTNTGDTKLRIDATNTDFTLNPVNLKTGIALSLYNEDDTNNTSIVSLGTATTYNNISATGTHAFQINNGLVFSVNSSNIDAYKSIVIRGGNALQVSNTAGTNYINFSSFGTSCYINNFDATGSNITQIGGVAKFTIGPSSVDSVSYITAPTEVAGSNNTRLATTAFVQTAVSGAGAGYATLAGTNAWTGTNTFNTNLPTSTIDATSNLELCNFRSVKNEAQSQIDNINFYNTEIKRIDDFDNDIGTLNGGQTETSVFRWTNAGNYGFTQVNGIANHQGLIEGYMNPTLGTHTFQLQLAQLPVTFDNIATCEWIFRLDTNNTFQDITLGISNSSNTFANCFAWRYTGTSFFVYINQAGGFYTCVNNTGNLYNKWIYIKIFITKLVVYFTLTDIATGTTDTYNYNSGGLMNLGIACGPAFAALQNTNGSTKVTIDYCSYSYVCNRK